MSIRYGISLILEPGFTAGLHRARQVVCSQYGCWAAEMHSVHIPLTDYFACPEDAAPSVAAGLEQAAADFRSRNPLAYLSRRRVSAETAGEGSIYVVFTEASNPLARAGGGQAQTVSIDRLRAGVSGALGHSNVSTEMAPDLRFGLLLFAHLPSAVFQSAVRFAEGVVDGVDLPISARISDLAVFRYESVAANEEWSEGSWATDLSWRMVNSYGLS